MQHQLRLDCRWGNNHHLVLWRWRVSLELALVVLTAINVGPLKGLHASAAKSSLNWVVGQCMLGLSRVNDGYINIGRGGYKTRR